MLFQLTLFNGEHMLRQKDEKPLQEGTDETRNDGNRSAKTAGTKDF
ncbi:hypothetical protein CU028_0810 [Enterococcus faecium]|nr:hypothetical protein [Enterococcus faecium]MBK4752374.1 hypothetical protein [Enterococcus faecium]MBK4822161.1 hypothetical protein [Enterococcus faecium]MBK4879908.1 hypothetical protein [Enterococcus faecium]